MFSYSALVQAMKDGNWVLLDNIHLAPSEVIERLNSLAEEEPTLTIYETLPAETWTRNSDNPNTCIHPNFQLFATLRLKDSEPMPLAQSFVDRVICMWVPRIDLELNDVLQGTCKLQHTNCWRILAKAIPTSP